MARQCKITGKKTATGNNRPFSLKATKRKFRPNLFWKKVFNPITGKMERMRLSAKGIRTLKKWSKEAGIETEAEKAARLAQENGKKTTNEEKGRVHKTKLTPKQKKELAAAEEAAKQEKPSSFETETKAEEK